MFEDEEFKRDPNLEASKPSNVSKDIFVNNVCDGQIGEAKGQAYDSDDSDIDQLEADKATTNKKNSLNNLFSGKQDTDHD